MTTNNTQTTDTTQILHTGQSEYWDLVKERTRMRNAISAFNEVYPRLHVDAHREAYVCDVLEWVRTAAREAGMSDAVEYEAFRKKCSELASMPELNEPHEALYAARSAVVTGYADHFIFDCPECSGRWCHYNYSERVEGGSLNLYYYKRCEECDFSDTNDIFY